MSDYRYIYYLVAVVCLNMFNACGSDDEWGDFYFEQNHFMSAFVYSMGGRVFHANGDLTSYAGDGTGWRPVDYDNPTNDELLDKYAMNPNFLGSVDRDSLRFYYNMFLNDVELVYSDTITQPPYNGSSGSSLIAYKYDADANQYLSTTLWSSGSTEYTNTSPAAELISSWIGRILNEILTNETPPEIYITASQPAPSPVD